MENFNKVTKAKKASFTTIQCCILNQRVNLGKIKFFSMPPLVDQNFKTIITVFIKNFRKHFKHTIKQRFPSQCITYLFAGKH